MPPPPPEPLYILRGHRAAVQCVAFLPNSKSLVAGDAEGELKLWDLDSQRPTASIRAHDSASGILQVACPAAHPWVISQGRDGMVKCWELQQGTGFSSQPVQQLSSGCYNFCRFALLEPGQTSSSCCTSQQPGRPSAMQQQADEPAQVVVDGFDSITATVPAAAVAAAAVDEGVGQSPPQQQQSAAAEVGLLSQQLRQQQLPEQTQLGAVPVTPTAAAAEGGTPGDTAPNDLTEAAEEQLMLRNAAQSSSSYSSSTAGTARSPTDTSSTAAAAAGPWYLALPSEDPANVGIWQLGSGAAAGAGASQEPPMLLKQSKTPDRPHRGQCMAVVMLQPQGSALHALTGYEDGSVALWDTRNSSTYLAAQKLHSEPVMCLAAAADCSSGFSGSADDKLSSFELDVSKGHLKSGPQLALPQQGLADVAIRPDGRIAATAGWDAKVRVWHCRKRQSLAVLRWHSQQVACVGFSRDNALLAAGGRDNFISMWSLYPPSYWQRAG